MGKYNITNTGRMITLFTIAILCFVFNPSTVLSEVKTWTTEIELTDKRNIVLKWVPYYEGFDTVVEITVYENGKAVKKYEVEGQPLLNSDKRLMALPYCAHDGCSPEFVLINLKTLEQRTIKIESVGQFYLQCKWKNKNTLSISTENFDHDKGLVINRLYEFNSGYPQPVLLSEKRRILKRSKR